MTTTGIRDRIDWRADRDRIDLAAVVRELLGPPPGRGGRGLWWHCPLGGHEDKNPSFLVDSSKGRWRCFGCGESGDSANLVMRIEGLSFPEAIDRLTGRSTPSGTTRPRPSPKAPPEPKPPAGPSGMPLAAAMALVVESEARLWSPEGKDALAYLTRSRALHGATIRAARLGWTPGIGIPRKEGGTYKVRGIVSPWFDGDRLALVKIRQPEGDRQKYAEAFRDRASLYPGRQVIRPAYPLVIVEGEFDALLLGQELDDLAAVATLGGTGSTKPEPIILGSMLTAFPWFVATDADDSGDKAAARWESTRARRVRPPEPSKDWTDARRSGVNLRRWWADYLGVPFLPYSWEALAGWRWGPAANDSEPGLIIDTPEPTRRRLALEALDRSGELSGV
jgi:hypothetical protein